MTTITDVRGRFTALRQPLAFFDGPGGTQVPDSVIDADCRLSPSSNANVGGPFATSHRTDELLAAAHETAAQFLGATPGEVAFGANMTTLNFALSRAASREWAAGDEIVCTRLDHDGNVAPWLELARDKGIDGAVRRRRRRLPARPRPASLAAERPDAGRCLPVGVERGRHGDAGRRDRRARARGRCARLGRRGALCAARTDRRRRASAPTCSSARRTSSAGRTSVSPIRAARDCGTTGGRTRCDPHADEPLGHRYETGTLAHELLAGFVATVEYLDDVGWEYIQSHERALGQVFLDGLPDGCRLYGVAAMEQRVPTFALNVAGAPAPGGRGATSGQRATPSGTATTTPSRSCSASAYPKARSASASCTTTRSTK